MPEQVDSIFEETVREGAMRTSRSIRFLLATGALGGIDVSIGILALLLVEHETGNVLLGALAFSIGFIAITLARSELFTENFLVPITALAAKKATTFQVGRLWAGTLVTNLLGGWVMMGIVIAAFPVLDPTAVDVGSHFARLGINWSSFALALTAGAVITLMTWMQHSTRSVVAQMIAAIAAAFLLAAGTMNHAIVASLEMFAALHAGAPFGYAAASGAIGWSIVGNLIGGIALVTILRLIQVGRAKVGEVRQS